MTSAASSSTTSRIPFEQIQLFDRAGHDQTLHFEGSIGNDFPLLLATKSSGETDEVSQYLLQLSGQDPWQLKRPVPVPLCDISNFPEQELLSPGDADTMFHWIRSLATLGHRVKFFIPKERTAIMTIERGEFVEWHRYMKSEVLPGSRAIILDRYVMKPWPNKRVGAVEFFNGWISLKRIPATDGFRELRKFLINLVTIRHLGITVFTASERMDRDVHFCTLRTLPAKSRSETDAEQGDEQTRRGQGSRSPRRYRRSEQRSPSPSHSTTSSSSSSSSSHSTTSSSSATT